MSQKIGLLLLVFVLAACQSQTASEPATEEAPASVEIAS
jgi:hypothetical protein